MAHFALNDLKFEFRVWKRDLKCKAFYLGTNHLKVLWTLSFNIEVILTKYFTSKTHKIQNGDLNNNYNQKHRPVKDNAYRQDVGSLYQEGCSLLYMSIITMRSRRFPANSASDCLRFAKSRRQFCESCGATYTRICEMFSALQSASCLVTDVENRVQIDSW